MNNNDKTPVAVPAQEKSLADMTLEDKKAMAHLLEWNGKKIIDCGKMELIDALIHLTAQVAYLQKKIASQTIVKPTKRIARLS